MHARSLCLQGLEYQTSCSRTLFLTTSLSVIPRLVPASRTLKPLSLKDTHRRWYPWPTYLYWHHTLELLCSIPRIFNSQTSSPWPKPRTQGLKASPTRLTRPTLRVTSPSISTRPRLPACLRFQKAKPTPNHTTSRLQSPTWSHSQHTAAHSQAQAQA